MKVEEIRNEDDGDKEEIQRLIPDLKRSTLKWSGKYTHGRFFYKVTVLKEENSCLNKTLLRLEHVGNEDDSTMLKWHGVP